jgi:hypothetical protein
MPEPTNPDNFRRHHEHGRPRRSCHVITLARLSRLARLARLAVRRSGPDACLRSLRRGSHRRRSGREVSGWATFEAEDNAAVRCGPANSSRTARRMLLTITCSSVPRRRRHTQAQMLYLGDVEPAGLAREVRIERRDRGVGQQGSRHDPSGLDLSSDAVRVRASGESALNHQCDQSRSLVRHWTGEYSWTSS